MTSHSPTLSRLQFALVLSACATFTLAIPCFPPSALAMAQPTVKIVSGPDQRTTYMAAFPKPLQVQVTHPVTKKGIARVWIHFRPALDNLSRTGASIQLSSESVLSDENGFASVRAVGLTIGTSSVEADVDGSPDSRVVFDGLRTGKAILTVIPANLNSTVGVIPALTGYTLTGFVHGETTTSAHITGTPLLTTVANSRSRDANYAIKGWPGTLSSPNYTFVAGFGTLVLSGAQSAGASEPEYDSNAASSNGFSKTDENPEAVRPALLSVSGSPDNTIGAQTILVRIAVDPSKTSYTGGQSARSASSIRAAVLERTTIESGAAKPSAIVRSTALQTALSNQQSSIKLQVAPIGMKAPGSN